MLKDSLAPTPAPVRPPTDDEMDAADSMWGALK